jgi:uncharacterized membrane protein
MRSQRTVVRHGRAESRQVQPAEGDLGAAPAGQRDSGVIVVARRGQLDRGTPLVASHAGFHRRSDVIQLLVADGPVGAAVSGAGQVNRVGRGDPGAVADILQLDAFGEGVGGGGVARDDQHHEPPAAQDQREHRSAVRAAPLLWTSRLRMLVRWRPQRRRRAWLTAFVGSPTAPASSGADHESRARRVLLLMVVVGLLAAIVTGVFAGWGYAAAVGWIAAGSTFCVLTAAHTKGKNAAETAAMAARDDPSPPVADVLLLIANTASLVAVAYLLVQGHSAHGARQALLATLALVSVAVSWALVHVLYMLRYAVLYYSGEVGGINFNQQELPSFVDFAYLAFTIGMTYQVSDTILESRQIRIAALRHALLSFVFGSLILASVVNLVAGLSR